MKKFIYILIALLTISAIAMAQIKMQVWLNDDEPAIFDYNQILKVGFVGESLPETPSDKPDDPEDKPITPEDPEEDEFVAKLFSVSATKTVTFSPGNLQYHAANNEWRFAPSQTDYIGYNNENISSTYNGWIDLFGWGTGNNPTNASTDYNDYKTFVDWGINKIGNDAPNTWRTLTYDEWKYLIEERPNYDKLIGVAQVNGVNGLILLPDGWTCPSGVTFKSDFDNRECTGCYGNYQTFSVSEWSKLEVSGAVFFPAAGFRYGSDVNSVHFYGDYWSATECDYYCVYYLDFYSEGARMDYITHNYGLSVRLVQDVATDPEDDPVVPPVKPDDGDDDIDTPEVELPGEGNIRFLIDATAVDACYGVGIEGAFCNWDPNAAFKGEEYEEGKFYIDMAAMSAAEFGNAKILLLDEDGTSSWDYQVSSNGYELGEGADNYITIIDEFGTQNAINLVSDDVDNVVIPVKILAVEDTPCREPVPAGRAKFVLTVTGKVPAGKDVIFTGNFEENSWGESDRVMIKQADGTYVWEGAYPENFQFKAFIADCEDLGLGEDDYGYILPQLWFYGFDIPVTADAGSVIEFEGCFEFLCPEDDDPVVPETGDFVAKPFSISATETITFSPGNLQYHAANNEWRFAPSQLDYIGEANANISATYNGWIDLFGWGTGNNPTNTSENYHDYQTFVDWGVNKIGNDAPNVWRILTYDEWSYLILERPNYDKLIGVAEVDGVNGLIILPDAWVSPDDVTFKSGFADYWCFECYGNYQTISALDWSKLEASGAVFLPAAGYRGTSGGVTSGYSSYWSGSATESGSNLAYSLSFYSDEAYMSSGYLHIGQSVRLVNGYEEFEKPITYTIAFHANGGSGDMQSSEIEENTNYTIPENTFTRDGYEFTSWNTKADGTGTPYLVGAELTITSDLTLYAQWEEEIKIITGTANGHDYVDLGLPSGTLWATCNVGATTPEEYGDYFAWGETEPKEDYSWNTYKWCNGSSSTLTKYCTSSLNGTVDNKTILELSDDAAYVNYGSSWRMPTEAEQDELRTECNWTWEAKNGVNGYTVTGPNGNSIFLPAAGARYDSDLVGAGFEDGCWSSSLNTSDLNYALSLYCNSDYVGKGYYGLRSSGNSVRAVLRAGISFDSNGGEGTMSSIVIDCAEVTIPENKFNRPGYEFICWNTKADGYGIPYEEGAKLTITTDLTLYAQWRDVKSIHDYVDLGLPSGTLWATMNVGADSPEDYGDYFAWGETITKSNYSWSTYKWCNGSDDTQTKYCSSSSYGTVDNKTILELPDDVAYVNWGSSWRMPTEAEQDELYSECTWTWGAKNGVNGFTVTGPNGNSIFLPAAGYRSSDLYYVGTEGNYWGGSLCPDVSDYAYNLDFISGTVHWGYSSLRYLGQSVRAVLRDGITFDSNGGEGTMQSILIDYAEVLTIPENKFTRECYEFICWNTKADGTGTSYEEDTELTITTDLTLYAQWKLVDITKFSVSENKFVTFSPGNLQYHPRNNTWRFAPSQISYIGSSNTNYYKGSTLESPDANYNGWIDLLVYGISTPNQIGNETPNTWRKLTLKEWNYILNGRDNAEELIAIAQVNGVNGLILLPDAWHCPSSVVLKTGFHSSVGKEYYAAYQTISASNWNKLEEAGAIFLPAAGSFSMSGENAVQEAGYYWSSTGGTFGTSVSISYTLDFNSGSALANNSNFGRPTFGFNDHNYGENAMSVRLVKD